MKAALERIVRRSDGVPERLRNVASYLLSRIQYDFGLMLHDVRYELSPEVRALLDAQSRGGVIAPIAALFEEGIRQGYSLDAEHGGIAPTLATSLFMNIISRFAAKVQEDVSAHTRQSQQAASADLVVRLLFYGIANPEKS